MVVKFRSLIVGNLYKNKNGNPSLSKLEAISKDINSMEELLETINGFENTTLSSTKKSGLMNKLKELKKIKIQDQNKGYKTVTLFYFSGHGSEIDGELFLFQENYNAKEIEKNKKIILQKLKEKFEKFKEKKETFEKFKEKKENFENEEIKKENEKIKKENEKILNFIENSSKIYRKMEAIKNQSIKLSDIQKTIEMDSNDISIYILDCCRSDPLMNDKNKQQEYLKQIFTGGGKGKIAKKVNMEIDWWNGQTNESIILFGTPKDTNSVLTPEGSSFTICLCSTFEKLKNNKNTFTIEEWLKEVKRYCKKKFKQSPTFTNNLYSDISFSAENQNICRIM